MIIHYYEMSFIWVFLLAILAIATTSLVPLVLIPSLQITTTTVAVIASAIGHCIYRTHI